MSHALKMLLGCLVPLLLMFVLPLLGVGEGVTLFVFIVLMYGCHLLMIRGHRGMGSASIRRKRPMNQINVTRFGFALGAAFAAVYLGCAFVMATVPRGAAVRFFNSITHGVDWEPVMRWDMPLWEMIIGVLEVFILGWLFGAFVAVLYNLGGREVSRA